MNRRRMLRTASVILVVLGTGHLVLASVLTVETLASWASKGVWAAVPLLGSRATAEAALNALAFWGGLGSFSVPLATLGGLIWHMASRGITIPSFVGWIIAAWCLAGALILVPSPFILGTAAGCLVVLAARRTRVASA
jgi:Family of unknown function (DUF6463)